jgi:exopolysaccharide production protein ExoZ
VQDKLLSLEIGRFAAATAVMLAHYTEAVQDYTGKLVFGGAAAAGHFGVPYFFVLSGFIIFHVHRADIGRPAAAGRFALRRAIRLLPMFWAISLVMLAGFLLIPGLSGERSLDPLGVAADLMLLPHAESILSISWTLRHEAVFYALFLLAIVFGRAAFWLIAIWIVVSLLNAGRPLTEADLGLTSVVSGVLNLGFGLGMIAAVAVARGAQISPRAAVLAGFAMLAGTSVWVWLSQGGMGRPDALGVAAYLFGSMLLIFGLVRMEQRGLRLPAPRTWRVLGGSSYILYLVHQPLASALVRLAPDAPTIPPEAAFLALATIAVGVSLALHLVAERPLLAALNSIARGARPRRATAIP